MICNLPGAWASQHSLPLRACCRGPQDFLGKEFGSIPAVPGVMTRAIAQQLLDSSSSVAANHRAAGKGRSHGEFTAKIGIVDEEADESLYWLEHLRDCQLVTPQEVAGHIREASELVAIFTTSAKTARANEAAARAARQRPKRRTQRD